jgi:tRNA threonylcarbamoyladenosine biosynthesis protein TsaE
MADASTPPRLLPLPLWRGTLSDEAATTGFGSTLARLLQTGDWILLKAPLGAGKTTLTRAILRALGHAGDVPSPSFTLVQDYPSPPLMIGVAHIDLYRLEKPQEVAALALDELSESAALIIEWPERLPYWPTDALLVEIALDAKSACETLRTLTLTGTARWAARLAKLNLP